ncbi:MAG: glycosyltransferase [Magnetococcus sp. THC-1_WYH]
MKKLAIFLPAPTPFYQTLLQQLTTAFARTGLSVHGGTTLLGEEELILFCRSFQPDAIFEMNRCRWEIPALPPSVRHISWIVDTLGRPMERLGGSDLLYFFGYNWFVRHPRTGSTVVDWLPPGSCQRTYHFEEWHEGIHSCSFVGHISFPWSQEELQRPLMTESDRVIRFQDFLPEYESVLQKNAQRGFDNDDYVRLGLEVMTQRLEIHPQLDLVLRYDIGCRVIRMRNRQRLLDLALATGTEPIFHGTGGWQAWPKYQPFFQGPLEDPNDVCRLYQDSRVNLHEGVGIHFRSMDCMSSGGVLFYLASEDDDQPGGINTLFSPETHFVSATVENFSMKFEEIMHHPEKRRQIARNAAREIRAHHTWDHRAARILADLGQL